MTLTAAEIRNLRQRMGWSQAEMARQLGCSAGHIQTWETGTDLPDPETLNQLRYLQNRVDSYSEHISQEPLVELEMETRRVSQLTHRDLLKDIK